MPVKAPAAPAQPVVLTFAALQADPYLRQYDVNEYVHSGYFISAGLPSALAGFFRLHNETANIWTHLLGLFAVLGLLLAAVLDPASLGLVAPPACTPLPVWPLLLFLCGASVGLLFSVLFHGLGTISVAASVALLVLDYIGILIITSASFIPMVCFMFAGRTATRDAYIATFLALTLLAAALVTLPAFRAPRWQLVRALAFMACGLTSVIPALHFLWHSYHTADSGREWGASLVFFARLWGMGAQYIAGALLFGLHIPERFAPGRYDLFPSHAFFHILVVTAILTHWSVLKDMWLWRSCAV
jgi:adiponectin receptor